MIERIVADTNIIIDHLRGWNTTFIELQKLHLKGQIELIIPIAVSVELFAGKETRVRDKLQRVHSLLSSVSVVILDLDISAKAGQILRDYPQLDDFADACIAATALHLGAELATRNKKDFEFIEGLRLYEL